MELEGAPVRDALVLELAIALRSAGHIDTADRLETAVTDYEARFPLSSKDRAAILAVLEEADALAELRGVFQEL